MTEISNLKVYDLEESVIACRNAMRLEQPEYTQEEFEKSLERAVKLAACGGGSGHSNFRKGILVSFDLRYSQYLTKQLQRYNWVTYISSSSLMHKIMQMDFSKCCNKYVTTETVEQMQLLIDNYNRIPDYENFMRVISNCPMGVELFVRVSTNYEQLATIYKQRKHHKLKEDWGAIIEMIENLPYFNKLIQIDYLKNR